MSWFRRRPGSAEPNPDPGAGRNAAEQRAGADINRMVQEFLTECRRRHRSGRLSVQNVSMMVRYHDSQSTRALASIVGKTGWVYRDVVGCIVLVSNDGDWYFTGKCQYLWPQGNGYRRETNTYSAWGRPDLVWFEGLAPQELERLSDDYFTRPDAIVDTVRAAIASWNAPRRPRSEQQRHRPGPSAPQ
jgi:hypothetical protein